MIPVCDILLKVLLYPHCFLIYLDLFIGYPVILCGLDILMGFYFHDQFEIVADASILFSLEFFWVLFAPFLDDSVVDLLYVVFWDPPCWFMFHIGHPLNVVDVWFYFILIDVLIILAVGVTDLCGICFLGSLHPVLLSCLVVCSKSSFMTMCQNIIRLVCCELCEFCTCAL